ncbi:proline--tRNA ligase [Trifolium repens]|nr:proline--tRNA ligase [Trifolium repens]
MKILMNLMMKLEALMMRWRMLIVIVKMKMRVRKNEDDEEETPVKKVDQGKKRPNESASKTPVSKKTKNAAPEKTACTTRSAATVCC